MAMRMNILCDGLINSGVSTVKLCYLCEVISPVSFFVLVLQCGRLQKGETVLVTGRF